VYHENTKLSPFHAQQLAEQFSVTPFDLFVTSRGFRQYHHTRRIALPESEIARSVDLHDLLYQRRSSREVSGAMQLSTMASLLQMALGPTSIATNAEMGISQVLRSWPSAGGLYPIDFYVVAQRVDGMESGLYHYNFLTHELEERPARDPHEILTEGFFWQSFAAEAALGLILVAPLERSLCKYGDRGYRLALLDAGHAAQNILLAAEYLGLRATAVGGFNDDGLAADLGIDGIEEIVIHALVLGGSNE
jgi:SagB-type dehydrogenase family enzyme